MYIGFSDRYKYLTRIMNVVKDGSITGSISWVEVVWHHDELCSFLSWNYSLDLNKVPGFTAENTYFRTNKIPYATVWKQCKRSISTYISISFLCIEMPNDTVNIQQQLVLAWMIPALAKLQDVSSEPHVAMNFFYFLVIPQWFCSPFGTAELKVNL